MDIDRAFEIVLELAYESVIDNQTAAQNGLEEYRQECLDAIEEISAARVAASLR